MDEIFINYRSENGGHLAAALDQALAHRFGKQSVFRDGRSIPAGAAYPRKLLGSLRDCRVLVVVIGPGWSQAPQLHRPDDWVRREILEARECKKPIVPVIDRAAGHRLDPRGLPEELTWLADLQALPYGAYSSATDADRIGDQLLELVPELTELTEKAPAAKDPGGTHRSAVNTVDGGSQGTVVQGRDFSGDVAGGNVIKGNSGGQYHLGRGDQYLHHHNGPSGPPAAGASPEGDAGPDHPRRPGDAQP